MVINFRPKISYHWRLFILLLGFSWVLVACFVMFQYHREKLYKVEKLDSQLQLYNSFLIEALTNDSISFIAAIDAKRLPIPDLRISIINTDGMLVFDNTLDRLPNELHLNRHEISEALKNGRGYSIRRHSESTNKTYFYSATKRENLIVRSAVPYSVSLQEILNADRSFFWFMLVVTLLISILGYFATRQIGKTITRLNRFAEMIEKGESVYNMEPFPHDELGSISNHIIRLYARLQQTMTERDREHKKALFEEQEKTRIKKQLTNNINHELKTPVAAIKICLETILEHRDIPANKQWEFIERCYANTERLSNLLNDVAAITRMDDGISNITKEKVKLDDIITDIRQSVTDHLHKMNMTLETTFPPNIVLYGNRTFLTSIFRNLIDNAIAYSNGSKITVTLENETSANYLFSVADNGIGIPPEHLNKIFERFYRIDKGRSRLIGGTGLGLSIVRNAVQIHGGNIYAINQASGGIKFIFSLNKQ